MLMTLPRRARMALAGAAIGVVLVAVTWYLSHYVAFLRRVDVSILLGFAQLNRPRLDRLTNFIASLCDPQWYVFLAVIPLAIALARRRLRVAAMIAVVLLGANETTQLLKPLLIAPRDPVWWSPISQASWPSGHATASMTLALCTVIAAPPRWRPAAAATMVAFALAVCYSFLELGWHYPSDVFGGFLVAATWTLLGIAALSIYEARRAIPAPGEAPRAIPAPVRGAPRPAAVTVAQALTPMGALLGVVGVCVALILLARPAPVIAYARGHEAFVLGVAAIGALGLLLAAGLTLMLRRG
ncbi:MAG TPA: phosphatase PAP2 family protein [Solirubrobacteraceae bacterium]|jgi:membrane-associated phospholipid phosphatase|nr:phosphatase PAP2 family protein [Solirubrobacteraceae bacterium]